MKDENKSRQLVELIHETVETLKERKKIAPEEFNNTPLDELLSNLERLLFDYNNYNSSKNSKN
jgi:hypothetical protein